MTAALFSINEFFGQSLQQQFYWTAILSGWAFVSAIILREFCKWNWAKGCGRLLGLGGFFLLFCYALHATDVATRMERMANERNEKVPTSEIAERIPESTETIVWRTSAGHSIRFTPDRNGRRASVSTAIGRSGCEHVYSGEHRQSDHRSGEPEGSGRVVAGRETAGTVRVPESVTGDEF